MKGQNYNQNSVIGCQDEFWSEPRKIILVKWPPCTLDQKSPVKIRNQYTLSKCDLELWSVFHEGV